mmetsp:Transcript_43466/g.112259  ORF Transcript_43466/g.112259 Transcript_43466/m.112259 type:complete len:412 (+) Transcript_43466:130-1365(+)
MVPRSAPRDETRIEVERVADAGTPAPTSPPPTTTVTASSPPLTTRRRGYGCWRRASRYLTSSSEERLPVRYPLQFQVVTASAFLLALGWIVHFLLVVVPSTEDAVVPGPCQYSDEQLQHNAYMLAVYFAGAVLTRSCTFVPSIAMRIGHLQDSTDHHGAVFMYVTHMVLHGPQYIFCIGSLLFWAQLLQSPICASQHPDFYESLRLYATYSCFVSFSGLLFAYWQGRLIGEAMREQQQRARRAPPGTMDRLQTIVYDPETFGTEDDKTYASECPICLADWDPQDIIKITACGHAFHKDCLAGWLKVERTCALCRSDVTKGRTGPPTLRPFFVQATPFPELPGEGRPLPQSDEPELLVQSVRSSSPASVGPDRETGAEQASDAMQSNGELSVEPQCKVNIGTEASDWVGVSI